MKKFIVLVGVAVALAAIGVASFHTPGKEAALLSGSVFVGDAFNKFVHEKYGFSFRYPKEYTITPYLEGDGAESIVFQGPSVILNGSEESQGFQIFITPFEETPKLGEPLLTTERILQDVPHAVLDGVQEIFIGAASGQNHRALLFWSEDPQIGRTREVWFVHGGYLYEITAYAEMDELLAGIMSTWRFE